MKNGGEKPAEQAAVKKGPSRVGSSSHVEAGSGGRNSEPEGVPEAAGEKVESNQPTVIDAVAPGGASNRTEAGSVEPKATAADFILLPKNCTLEQISLGMQMTDARKALPRGRLPDSDTPNLLAVQFAKEEGTDANLMMRGVDGRLVEVDLGYAGEGIDMSVIIEYADLLTKKAGVPPMSSDGKTKCQYGIEAAWDCTWTIGNTAYRGKWDLVTGDGTSGIDIVEWSIVAKGAKAQGMTQ